MTTAAAQHRRPTQAQRLLDLLADRRYHSMLELVDAGILRAGARIHELRQDGHAIETRRRRGSNVFEYRLAQTGAHELAPTPARPLDDCVACGDRRPLDPETLRCDACAAGSA